METPLINWEEPYSCSTIAWSLKKDLPAGVVPLNKTGPLLDEKWKAAICEGPEVQWWTWLIQEGVTVAWAPTVPAENSEFAEYSMYQMRRAMPRFM